LFILGTEIKPAKELEDLGVKPFQNILIWPTPKAPMEFRSLLPASVLHFNDLDSDN